MFASATGASVACDGVQLWPLPITYGDEAAVCIVVCLRFPRIVADDIFSGLFRILGICSSLSLERAYIELTTACLLQCSLKSGRYQ